MRRMYKLRMLKDLRQCHIFKRIAGIGSGRISGKLTVYSGAGFVVCLPLMLLSLVLSLALMLTAIPARAAVSWDAGTVQAVYENPQTGFAAYIIDGENLLSDQEETELLKDMIPVTAYGNAAFVSDYASVPASEWARSRFDILFGNASGTLFLVEMNSRELYLYSNGEIYNIVNSRAAASIVDNVYTYASEGDFRECAAGVYRQISTMMEGGRISQPMKHITNALIAICAAILLNYLLVRITTMQDKPKKSEVMGAMAATFAVVGTKKILLKQSKHYRPQTSSGSGSHSSGSFGGGSFGGGFSGGGGHSSGGGGGHSSGGGGGHSF